MKALSYWALAVALAFSSLPPARCAQKTAEAKHADSDSAQEKLIGAWRLVSIRQGGQNSAKQNKANDRASQPTGILIYTRDGHMSVQLMYPNSDSRLSNDYVQNGYEASFGSYDVNEQTHTITHHVQGSVTRGLVGKDFPRVFEFSDGRLIIKSSNPNEHWSVTWEHY